MIWSHRSCFVRPERRPALARQTTELHGDEVQMSHPGQGDNPWQHGQQGPPQDPRSNLPGPWQGNGQPAQGQPWGQAPHAPQQQGFGPAPQNHGQHQPGQPQQGWPAQPAPGSAGWSAPYGLSGPAPMPNGIRPAPPQTYIRPRRPGAVRGLVWVMIIIVLALSALVTLFVIGLSTGAVGSLVGLLLAILPVFPVAAALLWLDRFEDEPPALLAFAFAWGATAAVVIALVFSIGSMIVIAGAGGSDTLGAVVVAPIVEESAKGLAIIGVLLIRRGQFNGVVDGIVYAGLAGLGFAFAENILYLGSAFLEGGLTGAVVTFVLRCIMGPFAHPMFTSAFGIGVGLAVRARNPAAKVFFPLAGLAVAMCLHALWNGMATVATGGGWFVGYALLQVPIFASFVVFAVVARRREARLINQHLRVYAESGWITGQELAMLSSPVGRRQARTWASRVGGPTAGRAMRDFQELASELGFLRERIAHHAAPENAQRTEADLLRTMWQLRLAFQPQPGRW